jgi:SAM-dependent methyltransferase
MTNLSLDVGCGNRPKGNINVDIIIKKKNIHIGPDVGNQIIEPKLIRNFVLADACHLPFPNGCFDRVLCSHLIEHVDHPYWLLRELIRVSSRVVEVYTPHRFLGWRKHNPGHKCHFTKTWFYQALRKSGCKNFQVQISDYSAYPHAFLPLVRLPIEIKVTIWKT